MFTVAFVIAVHGIISYRRYNNDLMRFYWGDPGAILDDHDDDDEEEEDGNESHLFTFDDDFKIH